MRASLPSSAEPAGPHWKNPEAAPAAAGGRAAMRRFRVLIIDDDDVVRGSLAAVLECEGFAADEARDGIEGIARARVHPPDLVLLDLNMPHMDGWSAFTNLDHAHPLLPVIIITARPHQYKEAVRLGVDAFMEKPLDIRSLVHAVKRLTAEAEGRRVQRVTNRAFVTRLLSSAAITD